MAKVMTQDAAMRRNTSFRRSLMLVFCLFFSLPLSRVMAQDVGGGCGVLQNSFGPFDYRADHFDPVKNQATLRTYGSHGKLIRMVEDFHFTPEIEALKRGKTGGTAGGDLDYTLRVFPNHYRALIAMVALGEKEKTPQPSGVRYPIECWFKRAIVWQGNDNIVRMLYAQYLAKGGRENDATEQLKVAERQAEGSPFTLHNIGLVYFDMRNYDQALVLAHKAYAEGLRVFALREQLTRVGKWVDPAMSSQPEPPKN